MVLTGMKHTDMLSAKVTLVATLDNMCTLEELLEEDISFSDLIRELIQSEGIFGFLPDTKNIDIVDIQCIGATK